MARPDANHASAVPDTDVPASSSSTSTGPVGALLRVVDAALPDSHLPPASPELQRRGRLLVATSVMFFFVALFFGIQMVLVGQYPPASVAIMFGGCFLALANVVLLKALRSTVVPGALLCLETIAINSFQAYNDMGLDDPVLLWILIIPWLAAFLIRPIFGFLFAGLVVAVLGSFYTLEITNYAFPHFSGEESRWFFYFLCMSTVSLFIGSVGWIYEGQTLRNLREAYQDLGAAHKSLQKSQRRTEQVLESITDGFFGLDDRWHFVDMNRQAEQIFQRERDALIGQPSSALFSSTTSHDLITQLQSAAETGTSDEFVTYYEPSERWLEVHVYPFDEGLSVYVNDITARKEYERGLITAKEEAEKLAQLKSTLLANMSHEIRTPLTGVLGFAGILAQEASGEHQEFAELIGQNGKRLMETLNSVLDLAQLESGTFQCRLNAVEVGAEVEEVARLLGPLARENDLYLYVNRPATDAVAMLDSALLHRVLNNLIGNAIKFTHEGGVTVNVDADDEHVTIAVEDTGIGISSSFLPHLFEEFRQESTGMSRSYEGNGLGLAISRRLVEVMDGRIEVTSEEGVGTTFVVQFPRQKGSVGALIG